MLRLQEEIIQRIEQSPDKMISFRDYMDLCLYHPTLGYYMQRRPKIGKQGDFYTSSSVHPVFAETIARFTLRLMKSWGFPIRFCEIGGGTGEFAKHFLDAVLEHDPEAYQQLQFLLLEKSAYHQELQQSKLQAHANQVKWLTEDELEQGANRFTGVIFANEVADALPVYVVEKKGESWLEIGVSYDQESRQLVEKMRPLHHPAITQYLTLLDFKVQNGQRIEVPVDGMNWIKKISTWLKEGLCIIIDYGYRWEDLKLPRYLRGTLRSFYRHQVDDALYDRPGEKDLTADVCFDALSWMAKECGLKEVGLFPQANLLLMSGILELWKEHRDRNPFSPLAKKNRAIRHLISPGGISDAFSVLVLAKGVPEQVLHHFNPYSFVPKKT